MPNPLPNSLSSRAADQSFRAAPAARSAPRAPRRGTGFTLLELLVVIAVIAVLLGLLFPALGLARRSAKTAETKTLMNSVSNAIQSFNAEQQRSPGYFSQAAMGAPNNGGLTGTVSQGFTQMENAMLELTGALISEQEWDDSGQANNDAQSSIQFRLDLGRPDSIETAYIRPGKMYDTENNGAYLALSAEVLRPIEISGQFNVGTNYYPLSSKAVGGAADAEQTAMNYVMDPFDRPLVLWTADPLARYTLSEGDTDLDNSDAFAQDAGPANANADRALFYYFSNSGILRMNTIGQRNAPMGGGLLRPNSLNEGERAATLEALLGNPAFRIRNPVTGGIAGQNRILPLRPLGSNIIWSTGADGIFLKAGPETRGVRFYSDDDNPLGANASRQQFDDIVIPVP